MLTPRLLVVHQAVLEFGTVTAAASALGYSVSAVSHQLGALEREAGLPLWEKDGRRLRPTEAGILLAGLSERVINEIHAAETALDDLRNGRAGRVRVVSFHSAGEALLPSAIAMLQPRMPGIAVETAIDEADGALRRLRDGTADVAIVVEPYAPGDEPDDDLHRTHLLDDGYRILLHDGHRLSRRRLVDVGELADEGWVVTTGATGYARRTMIDLCRRAGFAPRIVAEADEYSVAQGYVAVGLAVSLAPLLTLDAVRRRVVVRRLRRPPEPRHIWILTRPALAGHASIRGLTSALLEGAASSQWQLTR
jgi:DNA-binding transcriptional LysR family regulator